VVWFEEVSTATLANPAKMIAKGAPHVIHNDVELHAYAEALFKLTGLESPSSSEEEAIELLTLLIERYESSAIRFPPPIRFPWCAFFLNTGILRNGV